MAYTFSSPSHHCFSSTPDGQRVMQQHLIFSLHCKRIKADDFYDGRKHHIRTLCGNLTAVVATTMMSLTNRLVHSAARNIVYQIYKFS